MVPTRLVWVELTWSSIWTLSSGYQQVSVFSRIAVDLNMLNDSILLVLKSDTHWYSGDVFRSGGTEMLVFGGFSGIMEANALLFSPGELKTVSCLSWWCGVRTYILLLYNWMKCCLKQRETVVWMWDLLYSPILLSSVVTGKIPKINKRDRGTRELRLRCYQGLIYSVGNCSYHTSKADCWSSAQGRSCVWSGNRCTTLSNLDPSDPQPEEKQCDPAEGRSLLRKRFSDIRVMNLFLSMLFSFFVCSDFELWTLQIKIKFVINSSPVPPACLQPLDVCGVPAIVRRPRTAATPSRW